MSPRISLSLVPHCLRAWLLALGIFAFAFVGLEAVAPAAANASGCSLANGIKHVVIIQFDNVHSERDNSNVPSDLEQIPALRNFITDNGTLLTDDHTVLISHTAGGIVSTETGLYPDRNGITVSNSYQYFDPAYNASGGSNVGGSGYTSAFKYWTDPVASSYDTTYNNDTTGGKNTPGPWAAFTKAGCDFAGLSAANMELENTSSDLTSVFPGFNFGSLPETATNLEGIAIHCSLADSQSGKLCGHGEADNLPGEPRGYSGYKGLFGAFQVWPVLDGRQYTGQTSKPPAVYDVFAPDSRNAAGGAWAVAPVKNLPAETTPPPSSFSPGRTSTSRIEDSSGNSGFPGFDGQEANNALGETAAAQEAGIPVTYTYISDVHDDHYNQNHGNAFGPGQAGDIAQLHEYNAAFTAFFQRLAHDHMTKANTLFLFTVDEGDHYAGTPPTNPGCDGVTTPCKYSSDIGEVDVNLNGLVKGITGNKTPFDEDYDDAPTVFVQGNPGADAESVRTLEREMSGLSEWDPIQNAPTPISYQIADRQEEQILHMQNADSLRLPTFTMFGNPDFFFEDYCPGGNPDPGCWQQDPQYVWNHGDVQSQIASTWQGWVGPGVQNLGVEGSIWTDHTDARPTLLRLTGLKDDYVDDGTTIAQLLTAAATPKAISADEADYDALSAAYKQLDAPFGEFGQDSLGVSTKAVATTSSNDGVYKAWDAQLAACQKQRVPLVASIDTLLNDAAFQPGYNIDPITFQSDTAQANTLVTEMRELDGDSTPPTSDICASTPPSTAGQAALAPSPAPSRAIATLSRGHRILGWGEAPTGSRIVIHHRGRLRGRYLLTVTIIGGRRSERWVSF